MSVKIAALMIVLNEERFLDLCLTRIQGYADQILIAEGATELTAELSWSGPDGASTDRTREIIEEWGDKVDYKPSTGPWPDKVEMYNSLLARVKRSITHVHLISPDEFYEKADLNLIKQKLAAHPKEVLAIQCIHYASGGRELHGGGNNVLDHYYHRIFPRIEGERFIGRTVDRLGGDLNVHNITEFKIQHYGHIDPGYSERKAKYYLERAHRWGWKNPPVHDPGETI
jgi:glycosyltransferase involved in cell wall biosynthesis